MQNASPRLLCAVLWFSIFITEAAAEDGRWAIARQDTLRLELVESGEIEAVKSTIVAAPKIWNLDMQIIYLVPEGAMVDSGDVVVRIDPAVLLTRLEAKQTELDMRRAEMKRMRVEHAAKIRELEQKVEIARYALQLAKVQLEQLKFESKARQEDGQLEVLKAEIALKEAETWLNAQRIIHASKEKKQQLLILQAENDVKDIEMQLRQLTLRAPISGMAVYHRDWNGRKPELGGKVRPGRGLIDLPDLTRMKTRIAVNEVNIALLQPGQTARVRLEAFPDRWFDARITSIAQIPEKLKSGSPIKVFEVELEIAQSDSLLKPGMTAQAFIELDVIPDAILLPIGCVFEKNGQPVVYPRSSPGRARPVQLGKRNDFYVQILDGVQPGEAFAWEPGDPDARPLGYLAFRQAIDTPDTLRQRFFSEMQQRGITFDYEAHRNKPPEPPGGAPGGMQAMLEKMGVKMGEAGAQKKTITLTPEMLKKLKMSAGGKGMVVLKADSTARKKAGAAKRADEKKAAKNGAAADTLK